MFDAATKEIFREIIVERKSCECGYTKEYDDWNWLSFESHLIYLEQMAREDAKLNKHQAALLFNAIQKICIKNPVCQLYSSFRGMQAIQLVTFINTCQ